MLMATITNACGEDLHNEKKWVRTQKSASPKSMMRKRFNLAHGYHSGSVLRAIARIAKA